jgi:nucleotide-binding universal stress UspA family protein
MKVLVSTDGSELSEKAIATAARLAKSLGATLVGMTAVESYEYGGYADYGSEESFDALDFEAVQAAQANERLAVVEQAAKAAGLPYELTMSRKGPPWRAILACARATGCDYIVLASHGRGGLGALLLGSETQKVLAHADRPVLVVR